MIIVDSSVWVSFFNGADEPAARRLAEVIEAREDVAVIPVIVTEVLQGFRTERGFEVALRVLIELPVMTLDLAGHVRAARLYRTLRKRGVTVRGAVDCVIAQTCLDLGCELLASDADFLKIASHSPLRLCAV